MIQPNHTALMVLLGMVPHVGDMLDDIYGNLWKAKPSPTGWSLVHAYNPNCILSTAALRVINLPGLRRVASIGNEVAVNG